ANPAADYVTGDVNDAARVRRAVAGVDAVCHQAARVGLGRDFADTPAYVADNDAGTAGVLAALWSAGFRGRLVLASSMVVYGEGTYTCPGHGPVRPPPRSGADLAAGRFEPRCPRCGADLAPSEVTEDAPTDPRNVYAATKLHQEHLCAAFGREAGVPFAALRYHNVYGPRMPRGTPYAGVASIFASALAAGRRPEVYEDGGQRRDFVHVRDVAAANMAALSVEPAPAGAFNIASGQARTVAQLARALAGTAGAGVVEPVVTGRYRLGDVRHIVASPERAAAGLGFRARVPFADGMAELGALLGAAAPAQ
ncbi:MAG: NAD-dependent epimerase/dehydratase family protein, partial [Acidimicrobiales bacterium]